MIRVESDGKLRVLKECDKLIEKTKKIETLISNSELMILYLSDFLKYEAKGINVFNKSVKDTIEKVCNGSDDKIYSLLYPEFEKNIEKINQLKSINAKVNQANKFKATTDRITAYLEKRQLKNTSLSQKIETMNKNLLKLTVF